MPTRQPPERGLVMRRCKALILHERGLRTSFRSSNAFVKATQGIDEAFPRSKFYNRSKRTASTYVPRQSRERASEGCIFETVALELPGGDTAACRTERFPDEEASSLPKQELVKMFPPAARLPQRGRQPYLVNFYPVCYFRWVLQLLSCVLHGHGGSKMSRA